MHDKTKEKAIKFINYKAYLWIIVPMLAFLIIINIFFRVSTVFSTEYATTVYPTLVKIIGTIFSLFPFSFFEIMIYIMILLTIFVITRLIVILIKHHAKSERFLFFYRLKKTLLNTCITLLAFLIVFTLNCGCNYNRLSFAKCNAMTGDRQYTDADLEKLANLLTDKVNEYADLVARGSDGHVTLNGCDIDTVSVDALTNLSKSYPCLNDYYTRPKPVLASNLMSSASILGIFSPFTIEANYNNDIPEFEKPYTICHELSHLSGFMSEDEANFISFLACTQSGNAAFAYSAYFGALQTVLCDIPNCDRYFEKFTPNVRKDYNESLDYWNSFDSPFDNFVSDIATSVNDSYLKINGQSEGVATYSFVTDLLLQYYYP